MRSRDWSRAHRSPRCWRSATSRRTREWFERSFNLLPDRAAALYRDLDAVVLGHDRPVVIASSIAASLRQAVLARVDEFHRAHPQDGGIGVAALRKELAPFLPVDAFQFLLRTLVDSREIEISRSQVRRAGLSFSLDANEQVLWQRIFPMLIERGASPPTVEELAADLRVPARTVLDLLHRLRKAGQAWQATDSRFYATPTVASLAATAAVVAEASPTGDFTAAQFRDAIGTGRGLAIHILELFDRVGVTLRTGDRRHMHANYVAVVGAGSPLRAGRQGAQRRRDCVTGRPRCRRWIASCASRRSRRCSMHTDASGSPRLSARISVACARRESWTLAPRQAASRASPRP